MKPVTAAILCLIVFSGAALGMQVQPTNVSIPAPGGIFSFDFIATSPPSQSVSAIQLTISSISGPSSLVLNENASKGITTDSGYWLYGNSADATPFKSGSAFVFGDNVNNGIAETISIGEKITKCAFTWDGTPGTYMFTISNNINNSFAFLNDFSSEAITLSGGTSPYNFAITIPEPVSLTLLGLGGLTILRKRSR
jgi:hypothetical protein